MFNLTGKLIRHDDSKESFPYVLKYNFKFIIDISASSGTFCLSLSSIRIRMKKVRLLPGSEKCVLSNKQVTSRGQRAWRTSFIAAEGTELTALIYATGRKCSLPAACPAAACRASAVEGPPRSAALAGTGASATSPTLTTPSLNTPSATRSHYGLPGSQTHRKETCVPQGSILVTLANFQKLSIWQPVQLRLLDEIFFFYFTTWSPST